MTSLKKCLIVDPMHESLFGMMQPLGWQVDYHPGMTRSEIRETLSGYTGLIVRSKTVIDKDLLGDHPTLKFVGRAGAGLDNVDLAYLAEKGIHVLHAAEGNRDAVGEFTVGLLLSLLRNVPRAHQEVINGIWLRESNRGEEIMGKTIGIIGFGNMGSAFAARLRGFGCKILAFDKYKHGFTNEFCQEADMERIHEETDILSLHIPLTDETRAMVNTAYLSRFKKKIILLNTSRGEIVPLSELAESFSMGFVRGAALDVLENEKLGELTDTQREGFRSLITGGNVIFTPHIAGWTFESHVKINVALVDKIKALNL
ncbi:MAG TPA: NAD(P)-dependent oxidoreductase [Chryseosolibacter sp.]|nr:NAD(P)-dependent oxidoreductase [Chryseosolibacter sp.]